MVSVMKVQYGRQQDLLLLQEEHLQPVVLLLFGRPLPGMELEVAGGHRRVRAPRALDGRRHVHAAGASVVLTLPGRGADDAGRHPHAHQAGAGRLLLRPARHTRGEQIARVVAVAHCAWSIAGLRTRMAPSLASPPPRNPLSSRLLAARSLRRLSPVGSGSGSRRRGRQRI